MKKNNKAILLMLFSAFTFSSMQIIIKLLPNISLMEKVFYRNFLSLIITYIIIKKKHLSFFGSKETRKYLFYRFIFGYLGVILFFYATLNMHAADAAMLNKLSPVFVTLIAHYFLKESTNKTQTAALIISLIGALLVIKPKFNYTLIPAGAGLLSAVVSGAAYIFITFIGNRESIYTVVFCFSFLSSVFSLPFFFFQFTIPNIYEIFLLILLSSLAAAGQIALTGAYNNSKASKISIFDYSNIIFSSILGFLLLSEVPDFLSIIGGLLIISASIMVYLRNKKN